MLIAINSNYLTNAALCSAYSVRCRDVQEYYSFRKQSQNCLFLGNKTILSTSQYHAFLIREEALLKVKICDTWFHSGWMLPNGVTSFSCHKEMLWQWRQSSRFQFRKESERKCVSHFHISLRYCVITAWALKSSSLGAEFSDFKGCGVGVFLAFFFYDQLFFYLLFCVCSVPKVAISDEKIYTYWGLCDIACGVFHGIC